MLLLCGNSVVKKGVMIDGEGDGAGGCLLQNRYIRYWVYPYHPSPESNNGALDGKGDEECVLPYTYDSLQVLFFVGNYKHLFLMFTFVIQIETKLCFYLQVHLYYGEPWPIG